MKEYKPQNSNPIDIRLNSSLCYYNNPAVEPLTCISKVQSQLQKVGIKLACMINFN